jgi:hypothetical protein
MSDKKTTVLELVKAKLTNKKVIYVDIDNTICNSNNNPLDYSTSKPWYNRIKKINDLYDKGHTIIYWTARGTITGIDWTELTTNQLNEWGCKYHKVILKKPYYDLFIDDKNINSELFFNDVQ